MAWCLRSGRARGFRGTSSNTPALGARGTCKVRSLCCRFQGYGFGVFRSQSSLKPIGATAHVWEHFVS